MGGEGDGRLPDPREPDPEEAIAHLREPSPQDIATAWVEAVMDEADLGLAWPLTEPVLRLVLAQDWVWANRHRPDIGHDQHRDAQDWDSIARGLADCPPTHPLWGPFARQVVARWHQSWAGFSTLTWRAWDEPEVVCLDTEVVTFVEREGGLDRSGGLASHDGRELHPARSEDGSRRFAMRHGDGGWVVASVSGGQMFVPGWPPSLGV